MTDQLGEVESPQSESVSDASSNDLRGMLGTEQPVETALPEQEQHAPEPLSEEAPQEAIPFEEEIPEGEVEGEQLAKRRIRPRTPEDQQVIDLYRSDGFDGGFDDAARIIYGAEAIPSRTQPTTEQPPRASFSEQADKRVSSIQQEIVELETKVNEATENLETGEALALQRQIMKKEMEAQDVRTRKASHQRDLQRSEEDAYRSKAVESRDSVYVAFPQLSEENSVPRRQFDDFVASAQNDPDYAVIFDSPKWPEIMAREFAGKTGMVQAAQAQQAPQQMPQQRAPVMGNQAKVLTSGTTTAPTNAPLTSQGVVDGMPNMTNEQLYQMLGNASQPANLR